MLDHHIQRTIVYRLALSSGMRFSDLRPGGIENKLFDYHLKKVLRAGYVQKLEDGNYTLTSEGRRVGVNILKDVQALFERAHSVIFLVIRDPKGRWLLYRRKHHPLRGKYGFMHITPNTEETVLEAASRLCLERTGLISAFTHRGSGYFRMFANEDLESFTHFDVLVADTAEGELLQNNLEYAEYFWADTINQTDPDLLPNMTTLLECYYSKRPFFIEKTFSLES